MTKKPYLIKSKVSGVKCRLLFTLLTLLFISAGSADAYADEEPQSVTIDGLVYTVLSKSNKTASVKAENTNILGTVEIQNQVTIGDNDYTVTRIENFAFQKCSGITTVIVPNGVTTIGKYAFSECAYLVSISIPNGVTLIDDHALEYCSRLSAVTIPSSVTTMSVNTFFRASNLKTIYFEYRETAFVWDGDLSGWDCPAEVKNAEEPAPEGCLTVIIPDGITAEGDVLKGSFGNKVYVSSGATITLSEPDEGFSFIVPSDGQCALDGNMIKSITGDIVVTLNPPFLIYTKEKYNDNYAEVSVLNKNISGEITIPSKVKVSGQELLVHTISKSCFENCTGITSLFIPNSVEYIENPAFEGCSNLATITIDNYNGGLKFWSTIPSGAKVVYLRKPSEYFFSFIDNKDGTVTVTKGKVTPFGAIVIPATDPDGHKVVAIAREAFAYSTITSVVIPEGVKSIGEGAFAVCQLLSYAKIPSSVTEIGDYPFAGCTTLNLDIAEGSAFSSSDGFLYKTIEAYSSDENTDEDPVALLEYFGNKASVIVPERCVEIADYAFEYCLSTQSLFIPETVSTVGNNIFENCISLQTVYVDNYQQKLNLDGMSSATVHYLKGKAPENTFCVILPQGIRAQESQSVNEPVYVEENASVTLTALPEGCQYVASDPDHCTIDGNEVRDITGDVTISIKSPKFKFTPVNGNGDASVSAYYEGVEDLLTETPVGYELLSGAIEIPAKATIGGTEYNVVSISENAFVYHYTITSVTIPEGVESIGKSAFYSCFNLSSVTLPQSLTAIGKKAFEWSSFSTITIPANVNYMDIGEDAFYQCTFLKIIYFQQEKPTALSSSAAIADYKKHIGVSDDVELVFLGSEEQLVYDITDENDKHTLIFNGDYEGTKVLDLDMNINPSIKELQFTRTFTPGVYSTIILPFKIAHPENCGEFYTFKGVNYDKTLGQWVANVYPVEPENVSFNTPYIFKSYSAMPEFTKDVTEISTYPGAGTFGGNGSYFTEEGKWAFCGMYKYFTFTDDVKNVYGFAGAPDNDVKIGDFVKAAPGAYVNPFRCVLYHDGEGLAKSNPVLPESIVVRVVQPDETESIEQPEPTEPTEIITPVAEISEQISAKAWSYNRTIYIESQPGTDYQIIDLSGRVIKTGVTHSTREEITLNRNAGIVIVNIDGNAFKVNL